MENFITEIIINSSRNIKDFKIPLSKEKRQHLILTGKNGSGKTSLLIEINKFLSQIYNGAIQSYDSQVLYLAQLQKQLQTSNQNNKLQIENNIKSVERWFSSFGGTEINFSAKNLEIFNLCQKGNFILTYFSAKRHIQLNIPNGINKISLRKKYGMFDTVSTNFLQYLVNLKADRSFARDDDEIETVEKIDNWFKRLETRLKYIFDVNELTLKFDRKTYNFDIITNEVDTFNFNNLSDGYSAIINIISELILRMEAHNLKSYNLEGVVIIDEIETHLHVDLQKKILPFLIDFFPKIQFIITTHSPFVISSVANATICDLEHKIITTDLSKYSYDALIESYFDTDKYSTEIKKKINEYEILVNKINKSSIDKINLEKLKNYFSQTPNYLSDELIVKIQEIELKLITKTKNS